MHFSRKYIEHYLHYSLVKSKLTYPLLLWCVDLKDVANIQNKAIRTITSSQFLSQTEPLFKRLSILKLKDLYVFQILQFYYKLYISDVHIFCRYKNALTEFCQEYNLRNNFIRVPIYCFLQRSFSINLYC